MTRLVAYTIVFGENQTCDNMFIVDRKQFGELKLDPRTKPEVITNEHDMLKNIPSTLFFVDCDGKKNEIDFEKQIIIIMRVEASPKWAFGIWAVIHGVGGYVVPGPFAGKLPAYYELH